MLNHLVGGNEVKHKGALSVSRSENSFYGNESSFKTSFQSMKIWNFCYSNSNVHVGVYTLKIQYSHYMSVAYNHCVDEPQAKLLMTSGL